MWFFSLMTTPVWHVGHTIKITIFKQMRNLKKKLTFKYDETRRQNLKTHSDSEWFIQNESYCRRWCNYINFERFIVVL